MKTVVSRQIWVACKPHCQYLNSKFRREACYSECQIPAGSAATIHPAYVAACRSSGVTSVLKDGEMLKGAMAPDWTVSVEINLCACTEPPIFHHLLPLERTREILQDTPLHGIHPRNASTDTASLYRVVRAQSGCQCCVYVYVHTWNVYFFSKNPESPASPLCGYCSDIPSDAGMHP